MLINCNLFQIIPPFSCHGFLTLTQTSLFSVYTTQSSKWCCLCSRDFVIHLPVLNPWCPVMSSLWLGYCIPLLHQMHVKVNAFLGGSVQSHLLQELCQYSVLGKEFRGTLSLLKMNHNITGSSLPLLLSVVCNYFPLCISFNVYTELHEAVAEFRVYLVQLCFTSRLVFSSFN